jgi:tRNA/tmRNA/rRNA uracil-C5-methylase (TrmA/RlmC/RlmD family)
METLADIPGCNSICRACHYKNLPYSSQLERKQNWALKQLDRWKDRLGDIVPAPQSEQMAYRTKSWMRTEFYSGQVSFGMTRSIRVQNKWEKEFISWDSCPIHLPAIQQTLMNLKSSFTKEQIQLLEASWVGVWFGRPHVVLVSKQDESELFRLLDWNQILVPPFESAWSHQNPQVGKKIFGHHEIQKMFGPQLAQKSSGPHPIRAFRQIAQSLLMDARKLALKYLLESGPQLVLDLYCGTGELALLLPEDVSWLGIEISPDAVAYANTLRTSHGDNGVKNNSKTILHQAFTGTIEDRLKDPRILSKISGNYSIFINPPRSGVSFEGQEKLRDLIRAHGPATLVYLSCSASSLARDLIWIEQEGFSIKLLQPFDFFPQTEHFETLAVLVR